MSLAFALWMYRVHWGPRLHSPAKIKVKEGLGETEQCGPGGELALVQGVHEPTSGEQLCLAKHLTMDIEEGEASKMTGLVQLVFICSILPP